MKLSKNDLQVLRRNWDLMQERAKVLNFCFSLDVSSSCYVTFGTFGLTVFKYDYKDYRKNRRVNWYRKTVNGWKEMSFDEFLREFEELDWELD